MRAEEVAEWLVECRFALEQENFASEDKSLAGAAAIRDLIAERDAALLALGKLRMCVVCGKTADADKPWPDCETPNCCTPDATPQEAWQHWRDLWHADRAKWSAERDRLRGASLRALDCLLGCAAPTGGCDDRAAYEDAIAALKRAALEQK